MFTKKLRRPFARLEFKSHASLRIFVTIYGPLECLVNKLGELVKSFNVVQLKDKRGPLVDRREFRASGKSDERRKV